MRFISISLYISGFFCLTANAQDSDPEEEQDSSDNEDSDASESDTEQEDSDPESNDPLEDLSFNISREDVSGPPAVSLSLGLPFLFTSLNSDYWLPLGPGIPLDIGLSFPLMPPITFKKTGGWGLRVVGEGSIERHYMGLTGNLSYYAVDSSDNTAYYINESSDAGFGFNVLNIGGALRIGSPFAFVDISAGLQGYADGTISFTDEETTDGDEESLEGGTVNVSSASRTERTYIALQYSQFIYPINSGRGVFFYGSLKRSRTPDFSRGDGYNLSYLGYDQNYESVLYYMSPPDDPSRYSHTLSLGIGIAM